MIPQKNAVRITALLLLILSFTVTGFAQPAKDVKAPGNEKLEAGPMLGYVEMMEANIWVQTTEPATVSITYWPKAKPDSFMVGGSYETTKKTSNTAHIKLVNLKPGTTYGYRIFINGEEVSRSYPTEFKTQELWQWRKPAPDFSFALGSCLYINDKPYDRPGKPYGGNPDILLQISKLNPDLMLWLGDNIYFREADFYSPERMDYRYRDGRSISEMQPLLAKAINLAIWDDHDYGPNNSDHTYRMRQAALRLFKNYWFNPMYGTDETQGVFFRYKYSDVEFFMMDDRIHRAPDHKKDPEKAYLGNGQLKWLEDALVNSDATFKFIAVGNQVTNQYQDGETYSSYPAEYKRLMNFIRDQKIEGVVFLSGDRHFTELLKTDYPGLYPIYEYTSSPLTSGTFSSLDKTEEFKNSQTVDGTLIYKERNFGIIDVSGKRGDRTLTLKAYNRKGEKRWEYKINENDLEFK